MRSVSPGGSVGQECGVGLVREGIAAIGGHEESTRIGKTMILAVHVRALHEHRLRMACRTGDALVVPALPSAEVICRIAQIRHIVARLVDEGRRAGLDSIRYEEAAPIVRAVWARRSRCRRPAVAL